MTTQAKHRLAFLSSDLRPLTSLKIESAQNSRGEFCAPAISSEHFAHLVSHRSTPTSISKASKTLVGSFGRLRNSPWVARSFRAQRFFNDNVNQASSLFPEN